MESRNGQQAASGTEVESHTTFLRQGSWLVVATVAGGVFMMGTQVVAQHWMVPGEYVVFCALLRVFLLMGIPSAGLQTVFAQQTASAVTAEQRLVLAATVRAVLAATLVVWCVIGAVTAFAQETWVTRLKIGNPAALWVTVMIGLAALWLPVFKGVLQGRQRFAGLGWTLILDGVGRFLSVTVLLWLGGQAAGGMTGALLGQLAALVVGVWLLRHLVLDSGRGFRWGPWLRRVVPFSLGAGSIVFISNADVVYVQSIFHVDQTTLYMPAAMIGVALVCVTTPLAAVMFPKVARSAALTRGTHAVQLALGATAALGALAALACTAFPKLPLQIIYVGSPQYWAAAPLVPWFAWALVPLIVANVLLGNLLARERFGVVPWVTLLVVAYGVTLVWLRPHLLAFAEPLDAFRCVLGTLGGYNLLLLAVTVFFTFREKVPVGAGEPAA